MKKSKNTNNPYQTILVLCVALIILFLWAKWPWAIWGAISIGLVGLLSPYLSKKIDYIWMQFAYLLSLFMPNILLTLVYFLLLVPLAFLSKIMSGKDYLQLNKPKKSTFKSKVKKFDAAAFENPW